jgi:3-hydroxybutyryl-CoA dehydrogenase
MNSAIKNAGVVGLGVMGFDIAFLYAMKGFRTLVYDAAAAAMDAVENRREQTIERLRKRNRINDVEMDNVRRLMIKSSELENLSSLDLITEAVSENTRTKLSVYKALASAGFRGLLTTNTSSVTRATLLGDGTYASDRFALAHFFNPVLHTQMVEVVTGDMAVYHRESLLAFLRNIGRQPVETQDISGFVSNGILMVYAVMALRLLESGATIEGVDQAAGALRLLPPLFSFDSWKPSIVEDVTRVMFEHRGDAFLRSSRLLQRLAIDNPRFYVEQKANPKIYDLAEEEKRSIDDATLEQALHIAILVAAARIAELGESPGTIDFVAQEGIKVPEAPLREIDALGAAQILEELSRINQQLGGEPLAPPKLLSAMAEAKQKFYQDEKPNPRLSTYIHRLANHARD